MGAIKDETHCTSDAHIATLIALVLAVAIFGCGLAPCWFLLLAMVGVIQMRVLHSLPSAIKCLQKHSYWVLRYHVASLATADFALVILLGVLYASRALSADFSVADRRLFQLLSILVFFFLGWQILYAVQTSAIYTEIAIDTNSAWAMWLVIGGLASLGMMVHMGLFVWAILLYKQSEQATDGIELHLRVRGYYLNPYLPLFAPGAVVASTWLFLLLMSTPLYWQRWWWHVSERSATPWNMARCFCVMLYAPLVLLAHVIIAALLAVEMSIVAVADEAHLVVANVVGKVWSGTRGIHEELGFTTWSAGRLSRKWTMLHIRLFVTQAAGAALVLIIVLFSKSKAQQACQERGWLEWVVVGFSAASLLTVFIVRFNCGLLRCCCGARHVEDVTGMGSLTGIARAMERATTLPQVAQSVAIADLSRLAVPVVSSGAQGQGPVASGAEDVAAAYTTGIASGVASAVQAPAAPLPFYV